MLKTKRKWFCFDVFLFQDTPIVHPPDFYPSDSITGEGPLPLWLCLLKVETIIFLVIIHGSVFTLPNRYLSSQKNVHRALTVLERNMLQFFLIWTKQPWLFTYIWSTLLFCEENMFQVSFRLKCDEQRCLSLATRPSEKNSKVCSTKWAFLTALWFVVGVYATCLMVKESHCILPEYKHVSTGEGKLESSKGYQCGGSTTGTGTDGRVSWSVVHTNHCLFGNWCLVSEQVSLV